ncbi:periplasmic heavy metal sensor [Aliiroseovarius sp. S1339]|uniref:periplasmic heavy metal sensor n=1 Tax=Aliiroseovarius sp. S1339 TaxID=2936990 RepID=UPI0020C15B6B|nr:periplasmic heavy metal sensor [Aliiroseovarius sp. S1339]MCK8463869.1 periplasmic heavy metal sensor [Aliiroseovarius sp. S1339]
MSASNKPPVATPQLKRRKWPRILLAVSLMFNLLVVGLVAGAKWGGHRDHGFDMHGPNRGAIRDLGFAPLAGALDRSDRREIGKALRERSGSFADNRKALASEFQTILTALRADPFDPDTLMSVMDQQSERQRQRGELARSVLVERIDQMSPKERQDFADRIERSIQDRARASKRRPTRK